MTTDTPRTFRTKTGTCTVTGTEILLAREGRVGALAEVAVGKSVHRLVARYLVMAGLLAVWGAWLWRSGDLFSGGMLIAVAAFICVNAIGSWNNSAASRIERRFIRRVEVHRPHPPLTRGYFAVFFADGASERRRLIMLPGSWSGGAEEFDRALVVMRESGVIS